MSVGTIVAVAGNLYPKVPVELRGSKGTTIELEATLDTGFTGSLGVPQPIIDEMELEFVREQQVYLADGSQRIVQIYDGSVMWARSWYDTDVYSMGDHVLVGMRLMYGSNISFDAVPNGEIKYRSIDLPRPRWPLSRR